MRRVTSAMLIGHVVNIETEGSLHRHGHTFLDTAAIALADVGHIRGTVTVRPRTSCKLSRPL